MQIDVQTPNFVADQKLIHFITKRLEKLELFYDRIISARVYLKVQKTSEKKNKLADVVVVVPGDKFVVKKEARTFEEASDMAAASLERSLKRFKQKQRLHTAS